MKLFQVLLSEQEIKLIKTALDTKLDEVTEINKISQLETLLETLSHVKCVQE